MDFSKVNMPDILRAGMANKFQDFTPFDFEDFIAQLFKDNGYTVKQTPSSGDYGADVLISKSGEKTAVQIKRYAQDNKVGVQEINQVVGARDFYKCDKAMIITTSSFTDRGRALAGQTSTELWDWDRLQRCVCDTYLEGKDYYAYFGHRSDTEAGERDPEFEFIRAEFRQQLQKHGPGTVVHALMKNHTGNNIMVRLGYPTFISVENRQVDSWAGFLGYFTEGVVYANSSVEVAFVFRAEQVPSVKEGDRIIFKWLQGPEQEPHTFDLRVPSLKYDRRCYVVTICFGKGSDEYRQMVRFRDDTLARYKFGRGLIAAYYRVGGLLVAYLEQSRIARGLSRFVLRIILAFIRLWKDL